MLFLSGICQTSNILKILFSILVIIKVAFIVVPIVLIVIIIINFLKSIIIKDNIIGKKLHIAIKRIIICLGIFFIPTVIESTTKLVNKAGINFSVPYGECIENASLSKIAEIEKYEVALKAKEEIITENNELNKQSSVDEKKAGENATENENITDENSNTNDNNDTNNIPTSNTNNSNNSNNSTDNTIDTNTSTSDSIPSINNTSDTSTITNDTSTNIPDNNTVSSNDSISTITTTDTSTTITNDTNTTNSNNTTNNTPDINTSSSDNSTSITPDTSISSNNNNTNSINNNNNTDIPNNNNTTNSSNNNSSTNNTNNSNQNNKINAEAFLNSLDKMSTIVEKDYKKGKIWHYSNAHIESTFEKERKNGRETNCAQYVSWALVDIGVLKEGQSIYKAYSDGKNEIKGSGANKIQNSKKVKIINANAKTPKELEQEGRLKPGDIMLWYNVQHTNVYAGNKKFYDAGHAGSNGCTSSHEYFKTWGPVKTSYYNNWKVWKIIRVKG